MADRFDNLSTSDLIIREAEARIELDAIVAALKAKLVAECPVKIGYVYRFKPDLLNAMGKPSWLRKRRILVQWINAEAPRWSSEQWHVAVGGYLNSTKGVVPTGTGFNRKGYYMHGWSSLDLGSAEEYRRDATSPQS